MRMSLCVGFVIDWPSIHVFFPMPTAQDAGIGSSILGQAVWRTDG